jgi:hypothetical protein
MTDYVSSIHSIDLEPGKRSVLRQGAAGAAQYSEFIIGPAKGRTRWLLRPYDSIAPPALDVIQPIVPCRLCYRIGPLPGAAAAIDDSLVMGVQSRRAEYLLDAIYRDEVLGIVVA